MSSIRKLRFWCYKVLPLVYDDSLSYYELLCKVVDKINEIIDTDIGFSVAEPIEWNITSQYPQNTLVIDSEGTAYISKQPVPTGIDITNDDYWIRIFSYGENINELRDQICYNAQDSATTEKALSVGDLVFWNEKIYKVISEMPAGMAFIEDTNVIRYTVEERIKDVEASIPDYSDELEALKQADDLLQSNINDERDARISADNALSTRIDGIDTSDGDAGALIKIGFLGRTIRSGEFKSSQGMAVRMFNGTPIIYTAYFNYDYTNLKCIVQSISFNGGVIGTSNEFACDHANDMTYDSANDLLYITSASDIIVMNPSTLAIVRTVSLNHAPAGIAYDADSNKIYTIENGNIRRLSSDFTLEQTWLNAIPYTDVQCLEYYDNHLYITMNQPNNVIMLDMNFNVKAIYGVQEFCSDYYPLGESQSISFYGTNGDFIINGKPREYNYDGVGFDAYEVGTGITTFGYGNFKTGVRYETSYTQVAIYRKYNVLNVDSTATVFTPTGDENAPFTRLGEISLVLNAPNMTPRNIVLAGDFSTEILSINNHNVNIGGNDAANPVPIYSANFYNCTGQVRNIRIMNDANGALHFVRSEMGLLYVYPAQNAVNQVLNVDAGSKVTVNPTHSPLYPFNFRTTSTGVIITKTGNGVATSNFALLAEYVGSGASTDYTADIEVNLNRYSELMFVVMRSSNSRIVDSRVVPVGSFINGGCYMLGGYSTSNTNILGGCFIYIDETHIKINFATSSATENFKYRIFAR